MKQRFSLDKSSKKFVCPNCEKKRFVRYQDNELNEYLPETVGRCDRENSCQYHCSPKLFFKDNPDYLKKKDDWRKSDAHKTTYQAPTPQAQQTNFLPENIMEQTMQHYEVNHFVCYLKSLFGEDVTRDLINRFHIGTSKRWKGATVFWQVDHKRNIHQAKIMLYNPHTGRRIKNDQAPKPDTAKIYFAGKHILRQNGIQDPNLQQCLFGAHQLHTESTDKPIAIVESEKTAVLMTVIEPSHIWLATGGTNGAKWSKVETCIMLNQRDVILFPDLGCFEKWHHKSKVLQAFTATLRVSNLLEQHATENDKKRGLDIADYFIRRDEDCGWALSECDYPFFWDK